MAEVDRVLAEELRVLHPGARTVSLDTTPPPRGFLRPAIEFHFRRVIPLLGRLVAGDAEAYNYLPASTERFLSAEALSSRMTAAGFRSTGFVRRMLGTVAIHWGTRRKTMGPPAHTPSRESMTERVVIAITGASGAIYGIRALQMLREAGAESHLIISAAGKVTISQETDWKVSDVVGLATVHYDPHDIAAAIASGSFAVQGMIVIPCSIKTLSGIANSYAED